MLRPICPCAHKTYTTEGSVIRPGVKISILVEPTSPHYETCPCGLTLRDRSSPRDQDFHSCGGQSVHIMCIEYGNLPVEPLFAQGSTFHSCGDQSIHNSYAAYGNTAEPLFAQRSRFLFLWRPISPESFLGNSQAVSILSKPICSLTCSLTPVFTLRKKEKVLNRG